MKSKITPEHLAELKQLGAEPGTMHEPSDYYWISMELGKRVQIFPHDGRWKCIDEQTLRSALGGTPHETYRRFLINGRNIARAQMIDLEKEIAKLGSEIARIGPVRQSQIVFDALNNLLFQVENCDGASQIDTRAAINALKHGPGADDELF